LNLPHFAAVLFLLALAAAPVAVLAVMLARSRMNPFQCLLWGLSYLLCKFLWRVQWKNPLPLRDDQGAVIICNHRADAKVERDEWRDQAKRLAMTLPAPEAAKPEGKGAMGLWKRVFG
jgi:hypothetical protein